MGDSEKCPERLCKLTRRPLENRVYKLFLSRGFTSPMVSTEALLIGIFRSKWRAHMVGVLYTLRGLRSCAISRYSVDSDIVDQVHWDEGFVTLRWTT